VFASFGYLDQSPVGRVEASPCRADQPEEVCTTKEIHDAKVNVLSMCGRAGTAADCRTRGGSKRRRKIVCAAIARLSGSVSEI
jgi:hypothetical protein